MATRARFGRLPRSAPSLTSTIVALAQEYQRVRESNIIDAWRNGGEFEGKKVTDEMLMKWLKERRSELSPDDPKWDYYDNQITQYEFAIANSKEELEYKRGNRTDMQMAAFYHKWAAKLPKSSEAYREREKLAAGYADRAASGRASSGRAASDRAYGAALSSSYRKEATYDAQLLFLTREAVNRGILRDNETLANIDPNTADGREINRLWDEIATAPEFADERAYYSKWIRENGDPSFNGDFSQDAFNAQTRIKNAAVNDRIGAARKAGREEDVNNFVDEKASVRGTKIITSGFDETEYYEDARNDWLRTFENPNATPLEVDRANTKYVGQLEAIRESLDRNLRPGETDPRLGWINNELRTMAGDEAPLEHWGGAVGPGENSGLTAATETAIGVKQVQTDIENLTKRNAKGEPDYVLVKTFGGKPVATTEQNNAGATWGVVRRDEMPEEAIYVMKNDYGDPRAGSVAVAVLPTPIYITSDIVNTKTGEAKPKTGDTPAAYQYTMPDGKTGFRFQDKSGRWLYTINNPFVQTNADGSEIEVPVTLTGNKATVSVPGNGAVVASPSGAIAPRYYLPSANVAMTSTVANSGYSLWLMASDPKDRAAYTQKPENIVSVLALEAGDDQVRFGAMLAEADQRRAVYLGNSTEEQQRFRSNAITGTPNPVPLSSAMARAGIEEPSSEAQTINRLIGGKTVDEITMELRESNRLNRNPAVPKPVMFGPPTPGADSDVMARKYGMVAPPPKPTAATSEKPQTSIGTDFPSQIANGLGNFFGTLFQPSAPKPASMLGGTPPGSMGAGTPPKPQGAPPPAKVPKPTPAPAPAPAPKKPDLNPYQNIFAPPKTPAAPSRSGTSLRRQL
jgi:hypothetical protein